MNSSIFYNTTAKEIGTRAVEAEKPTTHAFNGTFSMALGKAGMVKNNGLNTTVDRERYMDYCKDWMDKNN